MFSKAQFVRALFLSILCLAAVGNAANLVVNPGFETTEPTSGGLPSIYGDWKGDYSAIVSSTSGIAPMEGSKMLQFQGTDFGGSGGSATTCDIFQIVDISGYQSLIASGSAIAVASTYFNRVLGDAQTDTKFGLNIMAYDGLPSTFPSRFATSGYDSALSYNYEDNFYADSLHETWEMVNVTLNLPANTTFLVINLAVGENVYNDISYPEFDGHFVDNVSLQVVPEPATALLLSIGFAGLISRKKAKI